MAQVYDDKNPALKWCLHRLFEDKDITLISCDHPRPVFSDRPTLYYGSTKEAHAGTFAEYIPVPFRLAGLLESLDVEAKKMGKGLYLLKPLSKELYHRFRKLYPHRRKDTWEQEVKYSEILSDSPDSLLTDMENFPMPPAYSEWKEKIARYVEAGKFEAEKIEDAIFLLNHLFMGNIDDEPGKLREEFSKRYCREFDINPGSDDFKVLVVDDFFFLHIYHFSLVERCKTENDKEKNKAIHFDFECSAGTAVERLQQENYDSILLDIDFGQQRKSSEDVAEAAREKGIPIIMFSKFELAEKYDKFQVKWHSLPRIKKDLGYREMHHALMNRLEEVEKIKHNERISLDLQNARNIQENLLPKIEDYPRIRGLDFWGINKSCYEVSGDYYDFVYLEESNRFIFIIADVSGKGLPASLIMSAAHTALHTIHQDWNNLQDPARIVHHLYKAVEKITSGSDKITGKLREGLSNAYITLFYGELDLETGELRYVNAGHNPPFILSPTGGVEDRLEEGGPPIGILPISQFEVLYKSYKSAVKKIKKGDVICLYTDGVVEALNHGTGAPDADHTQLRDIIRSRLENSASEIGRVVFAEIERSLDGAKMEDDQTLVIVKMK